MPENELAPDVKRFLLDHITSVEHLEVFLLVSSSPGHWWTAPAVNDQLRSREESIQARLDELTVRGLLEKSTTQETFRLRDSPELAALAARLRTAYKDWRVRVIQTIYTPRTDPLSEFSRAFEFRKKTNG